MNTLLDRLTTAWCRLMHDNAMWPTHGHYECRACGREYPVPWESAADRAVVRQAQLVAAFRH